MKKNIVRNYFMTQLHMLERESYQWCVKRTSIFYRIHALYTNFTLSLSLRECVVEKAVKFNLSIRRVLAYYPFMHNNEREWARKKHKFCFSFLLFVRNSSTPTISFFSLSLAAAAAAYVHRFFFSSQSISFRACMDVLCALIYNSSSSSSNF
jgi:hypothetical protein